MPVRKADPRLASIARRADMRIEPQTLKPLPKLEALKPSRTELSEKELVERELQWMSDIFAKDEASQIALEVTTPPAPVVYKKRTLLQWLLRRPRQVFKAPLALPAPAAPRVTNGELAAMVEQGVPSAVVREKMKSLIASGTQLSGHDVAAIAAPFEHESYVTRQLIVKHTASLDVSQLETVLTHWILYPEMLDLLKAPVTKAEYQRLLTATNRWAYAQTAPQAGEIAAKLAKLWPAD